jgi:hypothetical protein
MSVAQGYEKVPTNGLVFMYDVADLSSYSGQPGTNITVGPNRNFNGYSLSTYSNGKLFETNGYNETVYIPTIGLREVQSVDIYNVYDGYGNDGNYNCCVNLFAYTGGWNSYIYTPGTTYTYQIIYRCDSGYTGPNFMYHYEYDTNGNYITEYGVHDNNKREHLGGGWYHAWNTFNTNGAAVRGYTGLWYYYYNVRDKVSVAAVSIAPGNTIRPARQLIPSNTTRLATQGLVPLTGNATLDLSNVSFDSNGQIYFDGTNDYIDLGYAPFSGTGDFTIDTVYTLNTLDTHTIIGNYPASSLQFMGRYGLYINGSCYFPSSLGPGTYHATATRESGVCKLYLNGTLVNTVSNGNNIGTNSFVMGKNTSGGEVLNGVVPIMKLYNRALTQAEVKQSYDKYKTRFNLS